MYTLLNDESGPSECLAYTLYIFITGLHLNPSHRNRMLGDALQHLNTGEVLKT